MLAPRRQKQRRGWTFYVLIVVPFCVALVLQCVLCAVVMQRSQTLASMDRDAYNLFSERVASNAGYLENDMVLRWSGITATASAVEDDIEQALANEGATPSQLAAGSTVAAAVVDAAADDLAELSRRAEVDGVYLVLADGAVAGMDGLEHHVGFYLRDANPKVDVENRSDLLLGACPISVGRRLGLALDSGWSALLGTAPEGDSASDFYYKPLRAAEQYSDAAIDDLGYWGRPTDVGGSGTESITYSLPLRDSAGAVLGVIGVEVKLDRITSYFPYRELDSQGSGSYVLAMADGASDALSEGAKASYEVLAATGGSQLLYVQDDTLTVGVGSDGFMEASPASNNADPAVASEAELTLYDSTSPFAGERWVLVGLEGRDTLFAASDALRGNLLVVFAFALAVGIAVAVVAAWVASSRMRLLMRQMRTAAPDRPIAFTPTRIVEVDELADAVSALGAEVAASASRLSRILSLSDRMIGAFEVNEQTGQVSFTEKFFDALGIDGTFAADAGVDPLFVRQRAMGWDDFQKLLSAADPELEMRLDDEARYLLKVAGTRRRWARLVIRHDEGGSPRVGLVEDVTEEITTRKRLEHERDHDILTGLLNRRAFERIVGQRLDKDPPPFGAMIMLDLDNLKFVNDTYGHDWGDLYIKRAGLVLERVFSGVGICSRTSGDEFLVFVDACPNEEAALDLLASLERELDATLLDAPDGSRIKLRASMGAAFFPHDAQTFDRLREYADFAMYEAKSSRKGELRCFDRESYTERSFLLRTKEDLNRLLEEHLVDYVFQPIVDVRAGEVMGYEALMRPRLASIPTPDHVIKLARSQSKLYLVEHMTFFESFKTYAAFPQSADHALFVNSIGTQRLPVEDEDYLFEHYGWLFPQVVVELTESDYDNEVTVGKERVLRERGCRAAIDDFGSGVNSEAMLLNVHVDFVKLDMRIVHGIDSSRDSRDIARALVAFAHDRNIGVIAEGVETPGELAAVLALDVDYVQGFLLGRPNACPQDLDDEARRILDAAWTAVRGLADAAEGEERSNGNG